MARSVDARRMLAVGVLAAAGAGLVSGCSTTQDEAARLQLDSARIRTAEHHVDVRRAGHAVDVAGVTLVSGRAIVVDVHNPGTRAVADLPISVGVTPSRGRGRIVNGFSPAELSYFDSHLPSIAPGASLTWVWTTPSKLAGRPFARVGADPDPTVTAAGRGRAPRITTRVLARRPPDQIVVALHNTTSVPQYQMPVYAIARRGGRIVAAGALTVPHLGSDRTERVTLTFIGSPGDAPVSITPSPTIFR